MLGVMARRSCAILYNDVPQYPVGRQNAVRINGLVFIFKRDDGTRRSSINLPFTADTTPPPAESGLNRIASRTWFLYRGAGASSFHTADYITNPANIRVPSSAENPDGNFRRVYDQTIDSYLLEVAEGVIVAKTKTGSQIYLVGTRATTPQPNDTYVRKSQAGYKVLTGFVIGGVPTQGTDQATGETVQGIANYPAKEVTGTVGAFDLKIRHAGSSSARPSDAGDTVVTNTSQKTVVQLGGAWFEDLGRPATEQEAAVAAEVSF